MRPPATGALSLAERAHSVILVAATLFVADLFLTWHRTTMSVPGGIGLHATSSGWVGWGGVAGIFAIALVALELRHRADGRERTAASIGASAGMLVAAGLALVTGRAEVMMATALGRVSVESTTWPAWAGLGLAVVAAVATAVAYGGIARRERDVDAPTPHAP